MKEWRNYHIYYGDLDRLIVECVHPVFMRDAQSLEKCFWERHYAGGSHLRVRLYGTSDVINTVGSELTAEATSYMARLPSSPRTSYTPEFAAKMAEMEDELAQPEDFVYRVNEILERPYQRLNHRLASDEAATLLEDFLNDCMPLAMAILQTPLPVLEQMLRLYFAEALFVSGDLPRGCVSFKSHWEGLAMNFSNRQLNERIESNYARVHDRIHELMLNVKEHYDQNTFNDDPILQGWFELLKRYRERTRAVLESGKHITFQYDTIDKVRQARQRFEEHMWQDSSFLRTLYDDERFLALVQYEPAFLRPRVLTNLLYKLVTLVGLNMIDKMALCYYAHRIVEDHFKCDLTEILEQNIECVVTKYSHRLTQQ